MGVIFSDTFTEASDTALPLHTPDVGTGWTHRVETGGGPHFVEASTGTTGCGGAGTSNGRHCSAEPSPTSQQFTIEATVAALPTGSGSRQMHLWACAAFDPDTTTANLTTLQGYAVTVFLAGGGGIQLVVMPLGGTETILDSDANDLSPGDVIRWEIDLDTGDHEVYINDVLTLSANDTTLTSPGLVGLGHGNFEYTGSYGGHQSAASRWDNFSVTEPDVGGGQTLDAGKAGSGATVPGADVAASGSVSLDSGTAGVGATVPGADVVASGSASLDAGVAGAGATVPGADLIGAAATLDAGVAGSGATVPGSDLSPSGSASLDAGVAGTGATVPGAEISGSASVLDAGVAGAGATVPGSDLAASGSAALDAGVAVSVATIPGADLSGSGSATLDAGVAGLGATVPGADVQEQILRPHVTGGHSAGGSHDYSPTRNTRTGYAWPVRRTNGQTVYIVKQTIQEVPFARVLEDIEGNLYRLLDTGRAEPL